MTGLVLSLLGLWVLLGAIWLAVWPLFSRGAAAAPEAEVELAELEAEKGRLLAELHELELDWETGKLSEEDRAAIESRLKGRAVDVMRRIDALRAPAGPPERRVERDRLTAGRTSG